MRSQLAYPFISSSRVLKRVKLNFWHNQHQLTLSNLLSISVYWECFTFLRVSVGQSDTLHRWVMPLWSFYVKVRITFSVRLTFLSVGDTDRSPFNCSGWTPHLLRNVCNQRRSEKHCPMTRIIYCSLLFRVLLISARNAQICSPKFILWMKTG